MKPKWITEDYIEACKQIQDMIDIEDFMWYLNSENSPNTFSMIIPDDWRNRTIIPVAREMGICILLPDLGWLVRKLDDHLAGINGGFTINNNTMWSIEVRYEAEYLNAFGDITHGEDGFDEEGNTPEEACIKALIVLKEGGCLGDKT